MVFYIWPHATLSRQLMTAVPHCAEQKWHSDNRTRGLTVIVPLVDFTQSNGSTQLLVGSHAHNWPLIAQHGAQVVQCPIGSIAAFDSRTYHRGLANETKEVRPALIFCYDRKESPPPGVSGMALRAHAGLASMLHILSAGYILCASSWKG